MINEKIKTVGLSSINHIYTQTTLKFGFRADQKPNFEVVCVYPFQVIKPFIQGKCCHMLKKNIDTSGRILRLITAIILLILAIWLKSWILLIASLFVFFEALMSWCVFYQMIGKNNCPIDSSSNQHKDK